MLNVWSEDLLVGAALCARIGPFLQSNFSLWTPNETQARM